MYDSCHAVPLYTKYCICMYMNSYKFTIAQDDDEATNRRAAAAQSRPEGSGVALPTSRWNVDGDELPKADIDVRLV